MKKIEKVNLIPDKKFKTGSFVKVKNPGAFLKESNIHAHVVYEIVGYPDTPGQHPLIRSIDPDYPIQPNLCVFGYKGATDCREVDLELLATPIQVKDEAKKRKFKKGDLVHVVESSEAPQYNILKDVVYEVYNYTDADLVNIQSTDPQRPITRLPPREGIQGMTNMREEDLTFNDDFLEKQFERIFG